MPELPEVETTRRGIAPHLAGRIISSIDVRERRLRWPVDEDVYQAVGQEIRSVGRRAKYLVLETSAGCLLLHLGMSGSLRIAKATDPPRRHDHFDLVTDDTIVRYHDPRRFGSLSWAAHPADRHPLLAHLGPEPLGGAFGGAYLYEMSRGRRVAVKNFIMNAVVVVGVGNIYASEALFMAGIHPSRPAGRIGRARYDGLAAAIRDILRRAIEQGGTTLRDFSGASGTPGYFAQDLLVYGRDDQPCMQCGTGIRRRVIGQRSSFFCPRCQR